MKKGQTSVIDGIENILFPMEVCRITQGDNVGTHKGAYATDLAGKDEGKDFAYFPFSARSVYLGNTATEGNAVIWQSLAPVRFADGVIDYCCLLVVHDNDPRGFEVGRQYAQGQQMAQEGTAGKASGNHLHVEFARGKYTGKPYLKNEFGVYELPNNRPIETCCFMDDTNIVAGVADWKYTKDIITNEVTQEKYDALLDERDDLLIKINAIKGIVNG